MIVLGNSFVQRELLIRKICSIERKKKCSCGSGAHFLLIIMPVEISAVTQKSTWFYARHLQCPQEQDIVSLLKCASVLRYQNHFDKEMMKEIHIKEEANKCRKVTSKCMNGS